MRASSFLPPTEPTFWLDLTESSNMRLDLAKKNKHGV